MVAKKKCKTNPVKEAFSPSENIRYCPSNLWRDKKKKLSIVFVLKLSSSIPKGILLTSDWTDLSSHFPSSPLELSHMCSATCKYSFETHFWRLWIGIYIPYIYIYIFLYIYIYKAYEKNIIYPWHKKNHAR